MGVIMTTPLRWGIIGTGGIARRFARDLEYVDALVEAVGSRSQESADAFGAEFGVAKRYGSYQAVVEDPAVDVVYVATPHPMHHENALLALEHDKPVLVEKAFTMTAEEARDLVAVARAKSLFLMEAMWTRFLPHVIALRRLLNEGALGDVLTVEADHGQWFEKDPDFRLYAPALGGGALLDLGVYPVSFASMVLGTPKSVTAVVTSAFTGVDGITSMLFGYESGAQAILTCTSLARSETRASIVGTEARIEIAGAFYSPSSFELKLRNGTSETFEFSTQGRVLHFQAAEVARCLRSGELESPGMPLDESVSIMETMEKVLRFSEAK
jgi:predicted dehydrogenase